MVWALGIVSSLTNTALLLRNLQPPHPCPLPLPVTVFSLQDAWKAEFRQDGPANAGADNTGKKKRLNHGGASRCIDFDSSR